MTADFWDRRYASGIGPGGGSRGRLYEFKLKTVQDIVNRYGVKSVLDLGCGDGTQLQSLQVGHYRGIDISPVAIESASAFSNDTRFYQVMSEAAVSDGQVCDMAVSLDVLFHLDDDRAHDHIGMLFHLSRRYVLIYAPNRDKGDLRLADHMFFREFLPCVRDRFGLEPLETIQNPFPADHRFLQDTSFCNFYLFEKVTTGRKKGPQKPRTDYPAYDLS